MTDNAVDYWGVARYHSINADAYDATNHWFADFIGTVITRVSVA